MFYLNSTLNFGIPALFVFQLEVDFKADRLLTGLTTQQKGTTARLYSNKTSLWSFFKVYSPTMLKMLIYELSVCHLNDSFNNIFWIIGLIWLTFFRWIQFEHDLRHLKEHVILKSIVRMLGPFTSFTYFSYLLLLLEVRFNLKILQ